MISNEDSDIRSSRSNRFRSSVEDSVISIEDSDIRSSIEAISKLHRSSRSNRIRSSIEAYRARPLHHSWLFLDQVMLFNSFTSCISYPVYFAFEDDDINVVLADVKKNDVTGQPATATTGGIKLERLSAGVIARVAGVLLLAVCIYVGVYKKKKVQDKILLSARSEHQSIQAAREVGPAPALIKAEVPWSARRGTFSNKDRVLKTVKGEIIASSGSFVEEANAADLIQRRQRSEFQSSVKGTLFTAIKANPDLVPSLLTLAMNDAMTYDKATKSGGPNGSVHFSVSEDVEEQRKESSLSATDNLVNEENAQLKDDETEAPDGTMVGDDLQNHNVSNAGNIDTVGKYFCYDLPVSEEIGVWIPVSVPPMSGSEHEEWNRGFSFGGGYFADGDMGWNQFVGEEKEMTMWDVVLDMLLVARGKVTALASD
ncbi:unnamed protein product [Camellia sinensis]